MLHYAESTIQRKVQTYSAATGVDESGTTIWTEYQNVDLDSYDDFSELGRSFEKMFPNAFQSIKLGHGIIKVIDVRPLVEFAQAWFDKKDHKFGNCM